MKNKPKIKESQIQKIIIDYLQLRGHVVVKINNVGIARPDGKGYIPVRQKGISDLIVCENDTGKFHALEVKREKGKPTEYQLAFLRQVRQADGKAEIVYSLDDVKTLGL